VAGENWALNSIQTTEANGGSFEDLATNLSSALQHYSTHITARRSSSFAISRRATVPARPSLSNSYGSQSQMYFAGQGRYTPGEGGQSYKPKLPYAPKRPNPIDPATGDQRTCFRCDSKEHLLKDCPEKGSISPTFTKKFLRYNNSENSPTYQDETSSLQRVYFELAEQDDKWIGPNDNTMNTVGRGRQQRVR
jgi:hypothetical protein